MHRDTVPRADADGNDKTVRLLIVRKIHRAAGMYRRGVALNQFWVDGEKTDFNHLSSHVSRRYLARQRSKSIVVFVFK